MSAFNQDKYIELIGKVYNKTPVDKSKPHGWIQYKGTDLCADIYCKCGAHLHIDADFCYSIKCAKCGTAYLLDQHITLFELNKEQEDFLVNQHIEPRTAEE